MLSDDSSPQADPSAPRAPAKKWRLAAIMTHPIQYLVPLLQRLARHPDVDLTVYFMTDTGLRDRYIEGFGHALKWDMPLLDGYAHSFLANQSPVPDRAGAFSKINLGAVEALRRGRFDAVYMHGYACVTEWVVLLAARMLGIPILFHGDVVLDSDMARGRVSRELFRHAFSSGIAAGLVPSTYAYRFYERYRVPRSRLFWTPLCVDNDTWTRRARELAPRKAELKQRLGVDPATDLVLFVAHMRPVKRAMDMVRGFALMKHPAALVMVGDGPERAEVERAARAQPGLRVHFVGTKNQGELADCYAAADVFVLTSRHEVNPLVIREAMCFGLPLVLSDGVRVKDDFVRAGENGFTYPMGDVAVLGDRLDQVLEDRATREAMGARSREIIDPWNFDVAAAGVVQALEAVARRPS